MMRRRWETIKLRRRSQQWNFMACKPIWMRNVRTFFSLHSVPVELTWIGSVPFAANLLIEKRIMQKTLYFQTSQCSHPISYRSYAFTAVSLRTQASFYLPGFDLYYNKHQNPFTFTRRGSFGIIQSGNPNKQKC